MKFRPSIFFIENTWNYWKLSLFLIQFSFNSQYKRYENNKYNIPRYGTFLLQCKRKIAQTFIIQ